MSRPYPASVKAAVIDRARHGENSGQISEALNVPRKTVQVWVREAGLSLRRGRLSQHAEPSYEYALTGGSWRLDPLRRILVWVKAIAS